MRRAGMVAGGALALTGAWLGPLPRLAHDLFAAHMILHVTVIAIAAPLLAIGFSGSRLDPVRRVPALFAPVPVSILELIVVWAWHAPALHALARASASLFVLEQASFLVCGLLVWFAAFGGAPDRQRQRAIGGVAALLLTSMHMTLLGVLLALADRALYRHGPTMNGMDALTDQHFGGVIMLFVGGAAYLAGALVRVAGLLKEKPDAVASA